jgi:hypothetical protein
MLVGEAAQSRPIGGKFWRAGLVNSSRVPKYEMRQYTNGRVGHGFVSNVGNVQFVQQQPR